MISGGEETESEGNGLNYETLEVFLVVGGHDNDTVSGGEESESAVAAADVQVGNDETLEVFLVVGGHASCGVVRCSLYLKARRVSRHLLPSETNPVRLEGWICRRFVRGFFAI
jgi:hypothetical protein